MQSAVLVIDVQQGLFNPLPRPWQADDVVARINTLTSRARAARVPVIFIQHTRADEPLSAGSDSWQLQQQLEVAPGDVRISKTTPDSFLHTTLQAQLEAIGAQHLVICGYASDYCVDTTTRRAAGLGYHVTLAADAHTTHDQPHASAELIRTHHNATLQNIESFGVPILARNTAEIEFAA
ncbi:cysteine hydrolase family protein [Silvimonas sp. JCM 19000]